MRTLSRVLRVSATALMLVPLIASSQEHLSEGWAEVKQEMIKLGMRYDSAWELYQAFETEAEGKTLEPNDLPDWSGLWTRDGGPSKFDNGRVGTASTASLKGEYLQMMQQQIDEAARLERWRLRVIRALNCRSG